MDGRKNIRTDERTNGRKLARLCLPAKAGATKIQWRTPNCKRSCAHKIPMLNVDGWTDGRTYERMNVRTDGNLHAYVFLLKQVRRKYSGEHQSQSTEICRSTSYNFVMQLLQSFRCIYVPSMMIIAAIVYEIQ